MSAFALPPHLSLIIPAHNEARWLPRLLASVAAACEVMRQAALVVEVIVVDNASTDETARIAADAGCVVVHEPTRVIGAVRRAGAEAARGHVVAFLDADSRIHPQALRVAWHALACPEVVVVATGVEPDRRSLGINVTWALLAVVARLCDVDTGVVACRAADLDAIGGYPNGRHFAEDVEFLVRLKRLGAAGSPRASFRRLRGVRTVTSTRKFDRYGDWHIFWLPLRVGLGILRGERAVVASWTARYWYTSAR